MGKWKCEICGMEFENFHAQGFDNKIYCPLCYFKELYRQTELERERLQNIINELEKSIKDEYDYCDKRKDPAFGVGMGVTKKLLDKLKELKKRDVYKRHLESQKQTDRLNEENKKFNKWIETLNKENHRLNNIINKAIEYIHQNCEILKNFPDEEVGIIGRVEGIPLLDILEGKDE